MDNNQFSFSGNSQQVFQPQTVGTTDDASILPDPNYPAITVMPQAIPAIINGPGISSQHIRLTDYEAQPIHRSYTLNHNGVSDAIREIICLNCNVYIVKDIENLRYKLIVENPNHDDVVSMMIISFAMVRKMPLDIQEKIRINEGKMISKCLAQSILNEVAELTKKVNQQEE